jgi:hypothetical protein
MRFHTTIQTSGKSATGILVPQSVVDELAAGKRIPVRVTLNGYTYRSTITFYRGAYMIALSAENRAGAGVAGGDEIDVDVEVDDAPREVEVPDDLAAALAASPTAASAFDALSYTNKKRLALSVTDAKTTETRVRRIAKALEELS